MPSLHPLVQPLRDWTSRSISDNILIQTVGRGHPASLQTIEEVRMMVEVLTDDNTDVIIPEARQPLSNALRIARGRAYISPSTLHPVADYLQNVCT